MGWRQCVGGALWAAVVVFFPGLPGIADDVENPPLGVSLEHRMGSLIVHGTRADNPVTEPLAPVLSQELTSAIIDREEFELVRPRTAVDALTFSPSFHKKRQGRKNELSLTLRGLGNTAILLNGLHLGTEGDSRYINHLPAAVMEEIRVIRDSASLIYGPPQLTGSGGIIGFGGVIDFRLLDPGEEHSGEVRSEFGRFNENLQHLTLSGPIVERLGYVLSLGRSEYGGPGGENMEDQYQHYMARLVLNYWGDSTLSVSVLREDGEREFQIADKGTVYDGYLEEFDPMETTISMLRLNHVWSEAVSTTLEAYYRDYEATDRRYDLKTEEDVRETNKGIVLRQTIRLPEANLLRLGAEASRWSNPTGKLYYIGMSRRETAYSFYLQDELTVVEDRLTLDAGVRWDRTHLDEGVISHGPNFVAGKAVALDDQWQEPRISYAIGANLRVAAKQTMTARWAHSQDNVDSGLLSKTGRDIEDATENRVELGYHVDACRAAVLTLTGFYSRVDNGLIYDGPIKVDDQFYPAWRTADFERFGVEFLAEGQLHEYLGYFANAMWMNSRVKPDGQDEEHDDAIPRWILGGGLRFQRGGWRAAVSLKYTYEYQDTFGSRPLRAWNLGDYWLLDANVGYVFTTGERFEHEVYCGMRNALNDSYRTIPGYDDPGRDIYAGYALKW